jgi:hypothetical protein
MGKRSDFHRRERDFYATPREAVLPLLPHLAPATRFFEPCAGDGALVRHLEAAGHVCARASDIEPQAAGIGRRCVLTQSVLPLGRNPVFITNPPWDRKILHPMIDRLSRFAPTWLLFDADWIHTKQAVPFLPWLRKVVSVGRVKWIPDSTMTGKDNCAWYLFDQHAEGRSCFSEGKPMQPEPALHCGPVGPSRAPGSHRGKRISEAEFRRLWADMGLSISEIGRRLGVSCNAVKRRAEVRGFPDRLQGRPFGRTYDHDRIAALYRAGLSMQAIARIEGCAQNSVLMALRRAGVKSRDRKDPMTTSVPAKALMAASARETRAALALSEMVDAPTRIARAA